MLLAPLVFLSGRVAAQTSLSAGDSNQTVVSVDALWDVPGPLDSAAVSAGFSIAGVLEVGVGMGLNRDEVGGQEAREVGGRITMGVSPIRQEAGAPLSLQLRGSYGLSRTHSEYLEDNRQTVRGQGFTARVTLLRQFGIQSTSVRLGVNADYRSYTYTTDTESPPSTRTSREGQLGYGAFIGLGVHLPSGTVLTMDAVASVDSDLAIQAGPAVRLSVPTLGY